MAQQGDGDSPLAIEVFRGQKLPLPREIIGKGVLYAGGKMILHGRRKYKKSMLLWWMLNRMRTGEDILGLPTNQSGIASLYLQAEIAAPLFQERDNAMMKGWPVVKDASGQTPNAQSLYVWNTRYLKLDTVEGINTLSEWVDRLQPLDHVCIDPLYKFIDGNISDPAAVTGFMDNIDSLIDRHNIAVSIVAHPRKPMPATKLGMDDPDDLLGASTWYNWVDAILKVVQPASYPGDAYILKASDLRYAKEDIDDIVYAFDRHTLQFYQTVIV